MKSQLVALANSINKLTDISDKKEDKKIQKSLGDLVDELKAMNVTLSAIEVNTRPAPEVPV